MEITSGRPWWDVGHESSFFRTLLLVCFVAILSYGASSLGAALVLASPNAFGAVAGLRGSGVGDAAGATKDVAGTDRDSPRCICHQRPAQRNAGEHGWRAGLG